MWLLKFLKAFTGLRFNSGGSDEVGQPPPLANQEDKTEGTPELHESIVEVGGQPTNTPASAGAEQPGRFLLVDVFPGDIGGRPNWQAFRNIEVPGVPGFKFIGGIIKASEGYAWGPQNELWFRNNWHALKDRFPERYGRDWFRGAYCFLRLLGDGRMQADYFLRMVEGAGGGWDDGGTIMPIVDVELGNETHPNQKASAQQIIDCTSKWAERVREKTGRRIMLYANGALRDKNITNHMGCDVLWIPRYTATLPATTYERAGWKADDVIMWQFNGDGTSFLNGYPKSIPGFGAVDQSVCINGSQPVTLTTAIDRLR